MNNTIGKKAEEKIREWLNRPEDGYSFDRINDQMTGFYGSKNVCDFKCYKYPNEYYIESKATENDRFDFSMITQYQFDGLLNKSKIFGCYGLIIILFVSYKRAFIVDIQTINDLIASGKKSMNINKIDKWNFAYSEIPSICSRKQMLDYSGEISDIVPIKRW